jgi:hypothetical protein
VNRWLALLIAVVGGAAVGYAALVFLANALAEIGWVQTFVEKPWPAWTDPLVGAAIIIVGLLLWLMSGWFIWSRLRAGPTDPPATG